MEAKTLFSANLILSPSPNVLASGSLLLSEPLAGHQVNERLNRAVNYVVNRPANKEELDYVGIGYDYPINVLFANIQISSL